MQRNLLAIYLNDHLAIATSGLELARRAAASNPGGELGRFLADLSRELDDDRRALLAVMRARRLPEDRVKEAVGWLAEKAGRLKLNGRLLGYSPLSRLLELEILAANLDANRAMWEVLARHGGAAPAPEGERPAPEAAGMDFPARARRAAARLAEVEEHRLRAAEAALAPG